MMVSTHVLIGILLGSSAVLWAPGSVDVAILAGLIGGIFPDLDGKYIHRKTFHLPICFSIMAFLSVGVLLVSQSWISVSVVVLLFSLAFHCVFDVFSGGLAPEKSKRPIAYPVYDHIRSKWIAYPIIRYDGSIEDLIVSLASAGIILTISGSLFRFLALPFVLVSLVYYSFRMRFHLYLMETDRIELSNLEV